jgi:hypothetical protein
MRRAVLLLVAGGLLVTPAACGTATSTATPSSTVATAAPETRTACEAVGEAYTKSMGPFAEAVAKAAGSGSATDRAEAQKRLGDLAASIRAATASAKDPQIVTDGKTAADQLQKKAADKTVFAALKTPQDASQLLGPTLKDWLAPVTSHCS